MSTISRRAFLKTVGVGALSVAAVSVLAGCNGNGTGSTSTGDAKPVTGKSGVQYRISDGVTVATVGYKTIEGEIVPKATLDVELADNVASVYVTAFAAKAASYNVDDPATRDTYKNVLTSEEIAECEAAGEKAVANMDDIEYGLVYGIFNATGAPIFLATASDASNTSGCVFLANCNGASIDCELDTIVVDGTSFQNGSEEVACIVTVPANAKEFNMVVTAPNATSVVTYTYTNINYVDLSKIDPSGASYTTEWGE